MVRNAWQMVRAAGGNERAVERRRHRQPPAAACRGYARAFAARSISAVAPQSTTWSGAFLLAMTRSSRSLSISARTSAAGAATASIDAAIDPASGFEFAHRPAACAGEAVQCGVVDPAGHA